MQGTKNEVAPVKLFLPQTTLEEWSSSDKADVSGGQLVVREGGSSHPVVPAVHFIRLVTGDDTKALVGRVNTLQQLQELGAEHLSDSCLVGEAAYQVSEGYLIEVMPTAEPPKAEVKKKSSSPEADLLAAFILDKL